MAMAIRWLLHSTCYLLGNPHEHHAHGNGGVKISEVSDGERGSKGRGHQDICPSGFQMPLHYPRYKKADYQRMEEWKLDLLLQQYGLSFQGNLEEKRAFAMGAFLWPDQY